ncbi:hypothetical protein SAY87_005574 [Trapa incisa]|uniref:Uncharacterized protein n=1 Tax=Trapa incisa TaxID=236973 RepID=A0AAN7Q6Q2_9MYRT|nr:hypothetical protein SAY87_005574 [Trapa incisa]
MVVVDTTTPIHFSLPDSESDRVDADRPALKGRLSHLHADNLSLGPYSLGGSFHCESR